MREIGNTVHSGIMAWRKLRIYFLIISMILASLVFAPTTRALSLPVVDRLLDTLLSLDNSGRNNSAQPTTTPAASPAQPASQPEQPAQPSAGTTNPTQSSESVSHPVTSPLEPELPPAMSLVGQATPLINTANYDQHDVLMARLEGAATASHPMSSLSSETCGRFFGVCWYVAAPIGIAAVTGAYLLIIHSRLSRSRLVSRLK